MYIPRTLQQCTWWRFYDILEKIGRLISERWGEEHYLSFSARINALLSHEGVPWRIVEHEVKRALPQVIDAQIKAASTLLTNPKFQGPDEQFKKAVEYLNKRPEPDEENCVKDAVGALEGVANVLASTTGVQLNTLLAREPFNSSIHPTIRQSIEKVYAYRGAAPGVGHSQVGPATVSLAESNWVLSTSAASILYLASKFPE